MSFGSLVYDSRFWVVYLNVFVVGHVGFIEVLDICVLFGLFFFIYVKGIFLIRVISCKSVGINDYGRFILQ